MKKLFFLSFICTIASVFTGFAQTTLTIAGTSYQIDTLQHFPVGPGSTYTALHFINLTKPKEPLRVFFLEMDATNPNMKFEAVTSNDKLRGTERPSAMAKRKTKNGAVYFAGVNGDFYNTDTAGKDYGTPINGFVSNGEIGAMPISSRAVMGFLPDKTPITAIFTIKGKISIGTESQTIKTINYSRPVNSLAFYNSFNGTTTNTDDNGTEVVISVPNDEWSISSGVLEATVIAKHENKGNTVIEGKQAVLSATGTAQAFLNNLNVGDKINLELSATTSGSQYSLDEMVGGEQIILKDGVWTGYEWAGNPVHPRTAMGYSADGKKVYACVVDGRYSLSAGANMEGMAAIMSFQGASFALNLDGGGSSCMYVKEFDQMNHPSDGGERAVSNALFAVATSPDDNIVSELVFQDFKIEIPIYTKLNPVVMAYNQYGVLVNKDISADVTFSCDAQIGKIDTDGSFIASNSAAVGYLYATYNGVTASRKVVVKNVSDINLSLNKVLIDDQFQYDIEVNGVAAGVTSPIQAKALTWTIADPSVCKIKNGVLTGLSNGNTTITGTLGDLSRTMDVTVEISDKMYYIQEDFSDLSSFKNIKPSSTLKNFSTVKDSDGNLKVSYTYTANTYSTIDFEKAIVAYSLPDTIIVSLNTGNVPFTKVSISLSQNNSTSKKILNLDNPPVGEDVQLKVVVKDFLADPNDIGAYPIKINKVLFYPADLKHIANQDYAFYIKDIKLAFAGKSTVGIKDEVSRKSTSSLLAYPNPVKRGEPINVIVQNKVETSNAKVSVYSLLGELVYSGNFNIDSDVILVPTDQLPVGNYILQVQYGNLLDALKILVK